MSRTPARVTQADDSLAVMVKRAATDCGLTITGIKPDGSVVIDFNQPPMNGPEHPGYVYFIAGGPFVKIGWTSCLAGRIAALQTGNPYKLEMLASHPGTFTTERTLHYRFRRHRTQDEWFALSPEIVEHIATKGRAA
jgi:hypothetical protein